MMIRLIEDIFLSRKELMKRKRNAAKEITMRPNWRYKDSNGTIHMSTTGREKNCICGKEHGK